MMSTNEGDVEPSICYHALNYCFFKTKSHRKEVEPLLFGKGKLDLTDPGETDETVNPFYETDDHSEDASKSTASKSNQQPKKQQPTKGYGSTDTSSPDDSLWASPTSESSPPKKEDSNDGPKKDGGDNVIDEEAFPGEDTFYQRPGRPSKPTRHWIVQIFFMIQTFAIVTNLALFVSQVMPLVSVSWDESDKEYIALKIYLCVFSIIFLLLEIDHSSIVFLRKASFLRTFASRGFLYTFFGLVCFEQADSEKVNKALRNRVQELSSVFQVSWFALANQIAAMSLISLGILYFLMGIVCLQRVRNRYVYDDRKKWSAYREALEKWDHGL